VGPMPHKGIANIEEMKNHSTYLKDHHFILGKDDNTHKYRSSTTIGLYADKSPVRERPDWANMKTHYKMGADYQNTSSDYSMRYQSQGAIPTTATHNESIVNKAKIEADTV